VKELRQIKLALIDSDFMSDRVVNILKLLDKIIGNLEKYESSNHSTYIFYKRKEDNIIVIEHNKDNNNFWVDRGKIWTVFENSFNINHTDIKSIIKWYVGRVFNIKENINIRCSSTRTLISSEICINNKIKYERAKTNKTSTN